MKQYFEYTNSILWMTEDGFSFSERTLPLPGQPTVIGVHKGKIFAVFKKIVFPYATVCFVSTDSALTWSEVAEIPPMFTGPNGYYRILSWNNSMYFVGGNKVYRSDDEGVTWYEVIPTTGTIPNEITGVHFLNGEVFLYSTSYTSARKTSDFMNWTSISVTGNTSNDYSTGSAIYNWKEPNGSKQLCRSTTGTTFSQLTQHAYGDEEYGITENLPPNLGFMSPGVVRTFEKNERLYFIHLGNSAVMSSPVLSPTNFQSESNATVPTGLDSTESISGDITFSESPPTPIEISSNFLGSVKFSAEPTLFSTIIPPAESNASFSLVSSFFVTSPELITFQVRGGIVTVNGVPLQGVKVYAIRVLDDALFVLLTDSQGKYILTDEMGTCHVMCVYKDVQDKLYSSIAYPYALSTAMEGGSQ